MCHTLSPTVHVWRWNNWRTDECLSPHISTLVYGPFCVLDQGCPCWWYIVHRSVFGGEHVLPGQVHRSFCVSAVIQKYNKCLQHRHAVVVECRWVLHQVCCCCCCEQVLDMRFHSSSGLKTYRAKTTLLCNLGAGGP